MSAELLDAARVGFAQLAVPASVQNRALEHLETWLSKPNFGTYRPQVVALIEAARWDTLLDSFSQLLPFGTGGRRGTVGVGPNRFNAWTLGASVQGHVDFLRKALGDGPLSVVIAHDVRVYNDQKRELVADVSNPLLGRTSRDFARVAAEIYAANEITVYLPAEGEFLSTPELSFAIRKLDAQAGLNISASHNPPDDNGGKFYNATGSQEVPPRDEQMAQAVSAVTVIERMSLDRARAAGLVQDLPDTVREAYLEANLRVSRRPEARSARVVFTALHGTGTRTVYQVLQRAGVPVSLEPTQAEPDGAFPHVPFGVPNPEVPRSMEAACQFADQEGADVVLACDPDADRLGLMALHDGQWRFFSGNEIAVLVAYYVLSHAKVERPVVLKTEVTTVLLDRLVREYGGVCLGHLLVGFKNIGHAIHQLETRGSFAGLEAKRNEVVLGAEESHGILVTTAIRDKDAAGAALLLAELASVEKDNGRTLVDTLHDIWAQVGCVENSLRSTVMRGAIGRGRIQEIQQSLRTQPPTEIGGRSVVRFHDRQDTSGPFGPILSGTDRSSRDVLVWELEGNARLILRPSGTEPKNKIYVEVAGEPGQDVATTRPGLANEAQRIAEDFLVDMLQRVELDVPRWALSASDLISLDHKAHFAHTVLPELERRLATGEDAARWLDEQVGTYGKDARSLLAPAVRRYLEEVSPGAAPGLRAVFGSV